MTHDHHHDFAQWARTWQDSTRETASADTIRDYLSRRRSLVRAFRSADLVVGAVALPVIGYLAWTADTDAGRIAMIGLASITIAAVAFGWWNWSAALRAASVATVGYVAASAEHLRRLRLAWRFSWAVLAGEVVMFVIWIRERLGARNVSVDADAERFAWLWLAGVTLVAAVSLMWFGRWLTRDTERFERLRRELEAEASD
jgi:hypothetical protein